MKYITKTLTLYRDLLFAPKKTNQSIETEFLWQYRCGVKHNETEPVRTLFLLEGQFMGYAIKSVDNKNTSDITSISKGKYLFLQGLIKNKDSDNHSLLLEASEELFLESLWQEKTIKSDLVFVRFLEEDGKNVFQIFREIEST